MRSTVLCLLGALVALGFRTVCAEDWRQFRGPSGNGVSTAGSLPTQWGPDAHLAWKVKLPGVGWSQPIVWGDKIFVTTAESDAQNKPREDNWGPGVSLLTGFRGGDPPNATFRWKMLCLDAATGVVLWERTAHEGRPTIPTHGNNTYASETPATDGERLVAYFGMTGLYGYDLAGKLLWSKSLESYPMQFGWGTGSSPVLHKDRVYVQCDNDQASFLAAFDARTGDELWRVVRDERSNWSTPLLWENSVRSELVTAGGNRMRSYNPENGELLWEMPGSGRASLSPVADKDLLYVDSCDRLTGRAGPLIAVRAGARGQLSPSGGDDSKEFVAWSAPLSAFRIASPLVHRDCLYLLEQQSGILRCFDAKTGKLHYRERLPRAVGFTASPCAADGKIYCLSQDGLMLVLAAGPKLQVLASNKLDEMFWSSPAIVGDRLLLRGVEHLYCIQGR